MGNTNSRYKVVVAGCVCAHIRYIHIHIHIRIHIYIYIHAYIYMKVYILWECTYINLPCPNSGKHPYMHTRIHIHTHVYGSEVSQSFEPFFGNVGVVGDWCSCRDRSAFLSKFRITGASFTSPFNKKMR